MRVGGSHSLSDGETIARRFDPADPSHAENFTHDEGNGQIRLKGGALRFDDDGCSVFRVGWLQDHGLGARDVTTRRHPGLATTSVGAVRRVVSGLAEESPEFDVRASPLLPPPDYAPAHASIVAVASYQSNSKRRQAITALAAQAFAVDLE